MQRLGPDGGVWGQPGVWPGDGGYVYVPTSTGQTNGGSSTPTSTARPAPGRAAMPALSRVGHQLGHVRLGQRVADHHLRRCELRDSGSSGSCGAPTARAPARSCGPTATSPLVGSWVVDEAQSIGTSTNYSMARRGQRRASSISARATATLLGLRLAGHAAARRIGPIVPAHHRGDEQRPADAHDDREPKPHGHEPDLFGHE